MDQPQPDPHAPKTGNAVGEPAWWYRISTGQVEFGLKTKALDRIGPFATEEAARGALELVRARSKSWGESEAED